jgi:ABC-type transport system involved in cytochrome c biogenesis permease component
MVVLPIVERELRVAARRPATYWARLMIAATAMAVCVWALLATARFLSSAQQGSFLFRGLSGIALVYALLAGIWTTADCLSSEKREGTLGLLFLTDLKGHDVVLGKLVATSLKAFYGLVALLPILALPILMGGVTAGLFWRTALALVNALLFSLAAGMVVSSLSRVDRKAMGGTLLLLLLVTVGFLVAADAVLELTRDREAAEGLAVLSPGYTFVFALGEGYTGRAHMFWLALILNQLVTWLLLALASRLALHVWRDKPASTRRWRWRDRWRDRVLGPPARRTAFRRRLLEINPILWLSSRERYVRAYPWIFLGAMAAIWGWGFFIERRFMLVTGALTIGYLANAFMKYWVATVAAHGFTAHGDRGALELLFSTPLTVRELLRGQWLALRRMFAAPLITLLICEHLLLLTGWDYTGEDFPMDVWVITMVMNECLLMLDCWAVASLGLWLGVKMRKPQRAASATAGRVLVLPWVGTALLAVLTPGVRGSLLYVWFIASLVTDLLFGSWARLKLHEELRQAATDYRASTSPTYLGLPLRG